MYTRKIANQLLQFSAACFLQAYGFLLAIFRFLSNPALASSSKQNHIMS
jgi:hypothetical protein